MDKKISNTNAIQRLLYTVQGTRVLRPTYGMPWLKYVDKAVSLEEIRLDIVVAIEDSMPYFTPTKVSVKVLNDNEIELNIEGDDEVDGLTYRHRLRHSM